MAAVTKALGSDTDYENGDFKMDMQDLIVDKISKNGKQAKLQTPLTNLIPW